MNLVLRITLLFAGVSLLVFVIGGGITFRVMKREVDKEQQRFLLERLDRVEQFIQHRQPKDSVHWHQMMIVPLAENLPESIQFTDTLVMHAQLQRIEPHLKLTAIKTVDEQSYYVIIYGVLVESDDIMDAVTESLIKIYLILLSVLIPIGMVASYFILRPFKNTLATIREFSLHQPDQQLDFPKSNVREFKKLNEFLSEMTQKVRHDYGVLKEFSENASHELQTPLAIMQSKLEVLMDGSNLTEEQVMQISQIQNALKRLTNLSNSLGLLTKIENHEFNKLEALSVDQLTSDLLNEFSELIELKSLKLEQQIEADVTIQADRVLIELLLINLINNAIRHNIENGFIKLALNAKGLIIQNSGAELSTLPDELFERFKKSNQSAQSLGLGLAIVKRICERYNFAITYQSADQIHTLSIEF